MVGISIATNLDQSPGNVKCSEMERDWEVHILRAKY